MLQTARRRHVEPFELVESLSQDIIEMRTHEVDDLKQAMLCILRTDSVQDMHECASEALARCPR